MRINILLFFIFAGILIYAGINYSTGIVQVTQKNGDGCVCHSFQSDPTVIVAVEGPDSLQKGQTGQFTIRMTGGAAVKGGFNVAAYSGSLLPSDGTAQLMQNELTHTSPKNFSSGEASWSFTYTADDLVYVDTIFSVGNSVNGDGNPTSADKWNFGTKFVLNVVDQPTSVENEFLVNDFKLEQNFPNPFNPSTVISFNLAEGGFISLKIYDLIGNEVSTLVDGFRPSGSNKENFTADGLSSGIYYYTLNTGKSSETKKMILLR